MAEFAQLRGVSMETWVLAAGELETAQALIDQAEPQTLTLKKLYGAQWNQIESATDFGMRFKNSVEAGALREIELAGKTSANAQLYLLKSG